MKNYLSIIITHANLAAELNVALQKLMPTEIPVLTYSNQTQDIDDIVGEVQEEIDKLNPEKAVIFVDLVGGSCWRAALCIKKDRENIAVLAGINIPGLVSFATNVDRLGWSELLEKIEQDAIKAIRILK